MRLAVALDIVAAQPDNPTCQTGVAHSRLALIGMTISAVELTTPSGEHVQVNEVPCAWS